MSEQLAFEPGDAFQDGPDLPIMIILPGGSFEMGSDLDNWEKPIHTVHIAPFAIGKFPVTQREWQALMGNNPSHFTGNDLRPVEYVSWNDAQAYIAKLRARTGRPYRLPSEAEWEYACRAGSQGRWCFGDDENRLAQWAWYGANSEDRTHPVGEKKINAFGLYDMHGNVLEWCEDRWHDNYHGAPSDGSAWLSGGGDSRVYRGGCYSDSSGRTRSASRSYGGVDSRLDYYGFRVALSL